MLLKSFGCSFIFGNELSDTNYGKFYRFPSQLTWPALLAKDLNYTYKCYAQPGAGNLRVLEKILNQAHVQEPSIFVIGWTWIDRFDYTTVPNQPTIQSEYIDNEVWATLVPVDSDTKARNYYRDLHSQYRDKFTNLVYIKSAIDILNQKNIPFIMTYMDNLLFESHWQCPNSLREIQNYIRPYMTNFDRENFLDWSKKNGFPISETLHPLEQAHQAAFELIKSYNLV